MDEELKELNKMAFDSIPSPSLITEYNRQLLKMTDWHQYQVSNTVTYFFHFEGHDDEDTFDSFFPVERSYLMGEKEVEQVWNDLAEQNSRFFTRKNLEIRYPSCLLSGADVF